MSMGNRTPTISSCMYSTIWTQKDYWMVHRDDDIDGGGKERQQQLQQQPQQQQQDDFYITTQITYTNNSNENNNGIIQKKNDKKNNRGYKHVPHKDKPAQVVARRNARERRRVQAVNCAFARLRKAVPIENTRGKRISKVKTLQYAIDYIYNLQKLLEQEPFHVASNYYNSVNRNQELFNDFIFDDDDDDDDDGGG